MKERIEAQICDRLCGLKNYIDKRIGKGAIAEDLYGDSVLKILQKVKSERFINDSSLNVFMIMCAKTVISDYYKKEKIHKRLLENEYVYRTRVIEESPEKEYEIKIENKKFIEKINRELDSVCRRIVFLLLFQNMKHHEIADVLGIPRTTVSVCLMRIRQKLGVDLGKCRNRLNSSDCGKMKSRFQYLPAKGATIGAN